MCTSISEENMNKERNKEKHDTYLVSSFNFSDYLLKRFESFNSVQNNNSEEYMVSSRNNSDIFFLDFSENKGRHPSDFREETRNSGSVLSLSPQDVLSLRKNIEKDSSSTIYDSPGKSRCKVNKDKLEASDILQSMNTSMNGVSEVIIDTPEQCIFKESKYSKNSTSKSNNSKHSSSEELTLNIKENMDHESTVINGSSINSGSTSMEKSKTKGSVKKKTKTRCNSQESIKKLVYFEKSFIETLLEYYEVQSTPIPSDDEEHSDNHGKIKHTNNHSSNNDQIRVNKKKKGAKESNKKRRRSNSGDHLNLSSSDDNKYIEFNNCDEVLFEIKKKQKLEHNIEQTVPHKSFSNRVESYHDPISSLQMSGDSESIENFTKDHERKKSKSRKSDHTKFNHKSEGYSINEIPSTENEHTEEMNNEMNIVQKCLKQSGKHKRRKSKSKYIDYSESENNLRYVSCTKDITTDNDKQFLSLPENKQRIKRSKNERQNTVEYNKYDSFKRKKPKNQLKIESSESELDISFSSTEKEKGSKENLCNPLSKNYENINLEDNQEMDNEYKKNISNNEKILGEKNSHIKSNVSEKESPISNKRILESVHSEVTFEKPHHSQKELEDTSQIETKMKKKHKLNRSFNDLFITDDTETPTNKKKGVSQKVHKMVDNFSKELEKKIKRDISFDNSIGEPKGESNILMNNDITICSDIKEVIEKNNDSPEMYEMNKNEGTSIDQNLPFKNFNMKNEKIDVCSDDMGENSASDSFEEIEESVEQINRNIWQNIGSENVGAEVLDDLVIVLPFNIPPLHVYVERPSKPTVDEINAYKDFPVKIGAYSQKEDQTIKNNWESFCKEHNLNIEPSAFFKFPRKMAKEEKVKFMQYISHGLENRLPRRVYLRFKTIFGNLVKKTGRFTKLEDKQMIQFMETTSSKKPFVELARILNRPSNSVERHYWRLHSQQKIIWTPSKAEQLINCMLKVSKLEDPDQLENQKLTAKQWKKVSKKMGGISVIKLQRAWNITIYPRMFANGDLAKAKRLIIDMLNERQETDWRSVDWNEISKKFPGFSSQKLYMMFKKLVIHNVPKHLQKDLQKSVECLKEKAIATPHKLRNYIYRNGRLVYEDDSDDDEDNNITY